MGCLIWVKFVEIPKQKLNVICPFFNSLIKHAVSANQSARYMVFFILIVNKNTILNQSVRVFCLALALPRVKGAVYC